MRLLRALSELWDKIVRAFERVEERAVAKDLGGLMERGVLVRGGGSPEAEDLGSLVGGAMEDEEDVLGRLAG